MSQPKTASDLFRHAAIRAEQRYGIVLYKSDMDKIIDDIQQGRSRPLKKQSRTRTWHLITLHNDTPLAVVYDKSRKAICTVLPPHVLGDFDV